MPRLLRLLDASRGGFQVLVARNLAEMKPGETDVLAAILETGARTRSAEVIEEAQVMVPGMAPEKVLPVLLGFLRREDAPGRLPVIKTIGALGRKAEDALPVLDELKGSPDEAIAGAAGQAMERILNPPSEGAIQIAPEGWALKEIR